MSYPNPMTLTPQSTSQEPPLPRANQACLSCRKQKRKCNKALPACALCERMNRHCDYSDATPAPTSEDFHALRMKLLELEKRLNGGGGAGAGAGVGVGVASPYLDTPPSTTLSGPDDMVGPGAGVSFHAPLENYQVPVNRFPAIAFLDSDAFKVCDSL